MNSGLINHYVRCFGVIDSNIFAGTDGGLFLSTNNGTNWQSVNNGLPSNSQVSSLAMNGSNIFAAAGRVFISTNNGINWQKVDSGLTTSAVNRLAVSGSNVFAGIYGSGVWRRPISEMVTSVEQLLGIPPVRFILEQNYPNPFNPTTEIKYSIPKGTFVRLKVYNMLGQEVVSLVNDWHATDNYSIRFDASTLPSGVYYYRLLTNEFSSTRKMLLIR
jgi:hypothetical protein